MGMIIGGLRNFLNRYKMDFRKNRAFFCLFATAALASGYF
jgi:hypothetical protein